MTLISRRTLLLTGSTMAALAALGLPALAVDIAALNKPPELGEMALGPDDAKVTIIEYASATCPHCAAFHKGAYKQVEVRMRDILDGRAPTNPLEL